MVCHHHSSWCVSQKLLSLESVAKVIVGRAHSLSKQNHSVYVQTLLSPRSSPPPAYSQPGSWSICRTQVRINFISEVGGVVNKPRLQVLLEPGKPGRKCQKGHDCSISLILKLIKMYIDYDRLRFLCLKVRIRQIRIAIHGSTACQSCMWYVLYPCLGLYLETRLYATCSVPYYN